MKIEKGFKFRVPTFKEWLVGGWRLDQNNEFLHKHDFCVVAPVSFIGLSYVTCCSPDKFWEDTWEIEEASEPLPVLECLRLTGDPRYALLTQARDVDEDPDPPSNPAPLDEEDSSRMLGLDAWITPPPYNPVTGQGVVHGNTSPKHVCTRSAFPILGKFFCTSCDKDMP